MDVVNLKEKLSQVPEHWSPRIVAELNDYHFKVARIEGEFVWHSHPETDEAFLVVDGELQLDMRGRTVHLGPGELFVVPRGVEHRPRAEAECQILMIEPAGTLNTGDQGGDRTVDPEWI